MQHVPELIRLGSDSIARAPRAFEGRLRDILGVLLEEICSRTVNISCSWRTRRTVCTISCGAIQPFPRGACIENEERLKCSRRTERKLTFPYTLTVLIHTNRRMLAVCASISRSNGSTWVRNGSTGEPSMGGPSFARELTHARWRSTKERKRRVYFFVAQCDIGGSAGLPGSYVLMLHFALHNVPFFRD